MTREYADHISPDAVGLPEKRRSRDECTAPSLSIVGAPSFLPRRKSSWWLQLREIDDEPGGRRTKCW